MVSGITGVIDGQLRQRYFLPDGRVVLATPSMHEFQQTKDGKVIASGIRDTNLDRGWLLTKPTELKLHCDGCDKWHDTQKEVNACTRKKIQANKNMARQTLEPGVNTDVNARMDKLEDMFSQILTKLGGK